MDASKTITVGARDRRETFVLSQKALVNCELLQALPNGAVINGTTPRAFEVMLAHLDGDERFNAIIRIARHDAIAMLVETWILAQQLGLFHVQDRLIDRFHEQYLRHLRKRPRFVVSINAPAFEYIRDVFGPNTHPKIEHFLIAWYAGLRHGPSMDLDYEDVRELRPEIRERIVRLGARVQFRDEDQILRSLDNFKMRISSGRKALPEAPALEIILPDAETRPAPAQQPPRGTDNRTSPLPVEEPFRHEVHQSLQATQAQSDTLQHPAALQQQTVVNVYPTPCRPQAQMPHEPPPIPPKSHAETQHEPENFQEQQANRTQYRYCNPYAEPDMQPQSPDVRHPPLPGSWPHSLPTPTPQNAWQVPRFENAAPPPPPKWPPAPFVEDELESITGASTIREPTPRRPAPYAEDLPRPYDPTPHQYDPTGYRTQREQIVHRQGASHMHNDPTPRLYEPTGYGTRQGQSSQGLYVPRVHNAPQGHDARRVQGAFYAEEEVNGRDAQPVQQAPQGGAQGSWFTTWPRRR
ncbi:hypothetical protein BU26DRAFT_572164 [Trematosphaeria pertusa]|uniref:BTB domain-containing protein n=1 Tax=Trematosphaeria pertusa TaxID=390896 RepID=A0A6A6HSC8_9PLEO|nr:uncharacterized protein BU26DRAFT_572164 [Trematosphaeria pertusa]KAF2240921.1 hypothetical protein BU26DRAFT_572164 [Trematosphaeria pertusa]